MHSVFFHSITLKKFQPEILMRLLSINITIFNFILNLQRSNSIGKCIRIYNPVLVFIYPPFVVAFYVLLFNVHLHCEVIYVDGMSLNQANIVCVSAIFVTKPYQDFIRHFTIYTYGLFFNLNQITGGSLCIAFRTYHFSLGNNASY